MPVSDPYAKYLENQMMTATPGKLLIMTFDAAIRCGRIAMECIKNRKIDQQSANIRKMQNILLELMNSINHEVDPQLASNLDALYTYMFDQLTFANIHDDEKTMAEVIGMLENLRSAWADAEMTVRKSSDPINLRGKGGLAA